MNENKPGKIYGAMADCMAEVQAVSKSSRNEHQGFNFRGIDAVMNELHGILAKNRVFISQKILDAKRDAEVTTKGAKMIHQYLTIEYSFTADDGSSVQVTVLGESADSGDKGANKCMAVALKYALTQVFCIPTADEPGKAKDPDADSHEFTGHRETKPSGTPAAPSRPREEGKLYVEGVETKTGTNKKGTAWTLYIVRFSDGREASTFDKAIGENAKKAHLDRIPVEVTTKAGYKEGKLDIVTLTIEDIQEAPPVEAQAAPDEIPGLETPGDKTRRFNCVIQLQRLEIGDALKYIAELGYLSFEAVSEKFLTAVEARPAKFAEAVKTFITKSKP